MPICARQRIEWRRFATLCLFTNGKSLNGATGEGADDFLFFCLRYSCDWVCPSGGAKGQLTPAEANEAGQPHLQTSKKPGCWRHATEMISRCMLVNKFDQQMMRGQALKTPMKRPLPRILRCRRWVKAPYQSGSHRQSTRQHDAPAGAMPIRLTRTHGTTSGSFRPAMLFHAAYANARQGYLRSAAHGSCAIVNCARRNTNQSGEIGDG